MKLSAIYEKEIVRTINPAVTAQDLSNESVRIEIEEYVFTDEIINSLYNTLLAIKNKNGVSKTGIWINGYYGSGKSHFLKYLHYCVNPQTREKAFERLVEAVKKRDSLLHTDSRSNVTNAEINDLKKWYENVEIEDILFNAQDVTKAKKDENTFTYIFFNMFNRCRGYNAHNIPLAVLFEKYLDEHGMLEEFKKRLKEQANFNWDKDADIIIRRSFNTVIDIVKNNLPNMDAESLEKALKNPGSFHIDVERFSGEVKEHLRSKGENYRLLFLVDEVSQYINDNQGLLLDLQTIVERISMDCNKQVWIACTAQQTVEEMVASTGISSTSDNYGKIMGRFETRVSLESTDPAYITQKRILDKNSQGLTELKELYKSKKEAILNQFGAVHELYNGFKNEDEFTRSYPFIPYQFKLISQVFESFQRKEFVVKEVKDNERSILKITHETAKKTMNWEVGTFIPFDEFYNNMFQQNLIHKGTRAINPTLNLSMVKNDPFAERVAKVLFMISNLEEKDQLNFKPTLDNLTLLLMKNVDENKMPLRNKTEEVLHELVKQNMIREEEGEYYFYNEDEAELSTVIKNTTIGLEARAEIINRILFPYIKVESKYRFANNDFKIMANIDGRNYFATSNPDVQVSFLFYDKANSEELSLNSNANTLSVCLSELFDKNKDLKESFDWYCKVEDYISKNMGISTGQRKRSLEKFSQRNRTLLDTKIQGAIFDLFNHTRFVSGQTVIETSEIAGKGKDRYRNVLEVHFRNLYKHASLANGVPVTADELRRKADDNKQTKIENIPMSEAEKAVNEYITRMGNEILLSDLIQHFAKIPYGWKDVAVIYIVTELMKRRLREVKYKNQLRFPLKDFVTKAITTSERSSLSITSAQEISQELINNAVDAWARIFNEHVKTESVSDILFDSLKTKLTAETDKWQKLKKDYIQYPFSRPLANLTDKLNAWLQLRDPKVFFETLIAEKEETAEMIDVCRSLEDFIEFQLSDYVAILSFYIGSRANLDGLNDTDKSKVKQMKVFFENENPTEGFRIIKKIHKELKTAIDESLKSIRTKTLEHYEKIFVQMEDLAKANKISVNVYANKEFWLERIAKEKDILQLRLTLSDANRFESEQREIILKEADKIKQAEEAKNKPAGSATIVAEPPISYHLPKANKILETESDIEHYVEQIRKELMEMVKNKKKIIIK
jgi:hypothetical protein